MSNKSVKTAPKFVYNCVSCGQYCSKIEKVPVSFQDIARWRKNGLLNGLVQNIGIDMAGGFPQLVLESKEGEKGCPMYDSENKYYLIIPDNGIIKSTEICNS